MDGSLSKIPDIWYDFYVRFLVGCYALVCLIFIYYYDDFSQITLPEWEILIVLLSISFMLGHILQPINAFFGRVIQSLTKSGDIRAKISISDLVTERQRILVSKRHAEFVSMVGFIITSLSVLTYLLIYKNYSIKVTLFIVLVFYFLIAVFLRNESISNSKKFLRNN